MRSVPAGFIADPSSLETKPNAKQRVMLADQRRGSCQQRAGPGPGGAAFVSVPGGLLLALGVGAIPKHPYRRSHRRNYSNASFSKTFERPSVL